MYDLKGACTDWTSNVENYRPNSLILLILRRLRANQGPNSLAGNFCTIPKLTGRLRIRRDLPAIGNSQMEFQCRTIALAGPLGAEYATVVSSLVKSPTDML